jgi:hypothetical protein
MVAGRDTHGRFIKGQRAPGQGRPEGSRNRFTELKDSFVAVFHDLNPDEQHEHLLAWAKEDPKAYYQIMSRLFPTRHELSAPESPPLGVIVAPVRAMNAEEWAEQNRLAP